MALQIQRPPRPPALRRRGTAKPDTSFRYRGRNEVFGPDQADRLRLNIGSAVPEGSEYHPGTGGQASLHDSHPCCERRLAPVLAISAVLCP
jgi:hypothetical protein